MGYREQMNRRLLERDNYTCQNCSRRDCKLDVHHIIPLDKGGTWTMENLISLC